MRVYASLKEVKDILQHYTGAVQTGKKTALATVVHVEGSSYRKPGARMLITEDGALTGAISGGCLEGDALRKALYVIQQQTPTVITYDTMDDDEGLGAALGCNGIVQVLLEPVLSENVVHPLVFLQKITTQRSASVLVTLFSMQGKKDEQPGTCLLYHPDEVFFSDKMPPGVASGQLLELARNAAEQQRSSFEQVGEYTAFVEFIPPPIHLVVAGDGNDIVPLMAFADILGWDISLLDGNRSYLSKMKTIPPNCRIVRHNDAPFAQIALDQRTALVLMTHNFLSDKALARQAFETYPFRYVGLLGPRKKRERLLKELAEEGLVLSENQLNTLHGPVGLHIGSNTPESIALSIVAEIQAVFEMTPG